MPIDANRVLYLVFSRAIHSTATPFPVFDNPSGRDFLSILRPVWRAPRADFIRGVLLDSAYERTTGTTEEDIRKAKAGTICIDGATNVLSHLMSNFVVHTPLSFFIEYLRADLKRETTSNVVSRLKNTMGRLDEKVGFKCTNSFISDSYNGMRDVCKVLVEEKIATWEYGCVTQS